MLDTCFVEADGLTADASLLDVARLTRVVDALTAAAVPHLRGDTTSAAPTPAADEIRDPESPSKAGAGAGLGRPSTILLIRGSHVDVAVCEREGTPTTTPMKAPTADDHSAPGTGAPSPPRRLLSVAIKHAVAAIERPSAAAAAAGDRVRAARRACAGGGDGAALTGAVPRQFPALPNELFARSESWDAEDMQEVGRALLNDASDSTDSGRPPRPSLPDAATPSPSPPELLVKVACAGLAVATLGRPLLHLAGHVTAADAAAQVILTLAHHLPQPALSPVPPTPRHR
jgi:hypothetical protein